MKDSHMHMHNEHKYQDSSDMSHHSLDSLNTLLLSLIPRKRLWSTLPPESWQLLILAARPILRRVVAAHTKGEDSTQVTIDLLKLPGEILVKSLFNKRQ